MTEFPKWRMQIAHASEVKFVADDAHPRDLIDRGPRTMLEVYERLVPFQEAMNEFGIFADIRHISVRWKGPHDSGQHEKFVTVTEDVFQTVDAPARVWEVALWPQSHEDQARAEEQRRWQEWIERGGQYPPPERVQIPPDDVPILTLSIEEEPDGNPTGKRTIIHNDDGTTTWKPSMRRQFEVYVSTYRGNTPLKLRRDL